jgi:DNA-binding transcriptional LysR family regulator
LFVAWGDSVSCPICEKRKPERFCPAKGEKICAVCCGTEREVSIGCPSDCSYLIAAHRYENEHQRALPADTPLLDEKIPQDIVYTHQQLMSALAFSIAKFCALQPSATDPDVLAALQALAQTYKTLSSGIIYEKPPDAPLPRELYAALIALLSEVKKQQAERANSAAWKDSETFYLLVFLYRMGLLRTNDRPRSRRFIEFLRAQFPQAPDLKREEGRIIIP